jgi:NhaA family Na+:H+ antiporter
VAADLGVNADFVLGDSDAVRRARARVEAFMRDREQEVFR